MAPSSSVLFSSGTTRPKSMPMTRPKPRQASQEPSGELKRKRCWVADPCIRYRNRRSAAGRWISRRARRCLRRPARGRTDGPGAHAQGRVQTLHGAVAFHRGEAEAILHDAQHALGDARVARLAGLRALGLAFLFGGAELAGGLVPRWQCGRFAFLRVHARVALLLQETTYLVLGEVGRYLDGKGHHQAAIVRAGRARLQRTEDRVGRVAPHGQPAAAAVQPGPAREQQFHVVVQFRRGADRAVELRTGLVWSMAIAGRMPSIRSTCGLSHAVQELAGVGEKRFDVAPLPFGIQGIEGQGALPRGRIRRSRRRFAGGERYVQVFEVVLASANDADFGCHFRIVAWVSSGAGLCLVEGGDCRRRYPQQVAAHRRLWNNPAILWIA